MSDPRPPDSPENPHAGHGPVVLDIGGDVGAVVVTMPDSMVGQEVDIAPGGQERLEHGHDDHGHDHGHGHGHGHGDDHGDDVGHGHGHGHGHPHVAVVRRPLGDGREVASLVYPEVVQGRYSLLMKGSHDVVLQVEVRGGEVTMAEWPTD